MLLETARSSTQTHSTIPVRSDVMNLALAPYFESCRYLQNAVVTHGDFLAEAPIPRDLTIEGTFSIPQSWYITNTGHFNSVEFNLCFNQLGYLLFAQSIQAGLMKPFQNWDQSTFERKQLPDVLIVGMESSFRKEISASEFVGKTHLHTMKTARNQVFTKWAVEFSDRFGGKATGNVFCCTRLLA